MRAFQSGNGDRGKYLNLSESKGLYPVSILDGAHVRPQVFSCFWLSDCIQGQ